MIASDTVEYFHEHINVILNDLGAGVKSEDIISIYDEFKGVGYALNTEVSS